MIQACRPQGQEGDPLLLLRLKRRPGCTTEAIDFTCALPEFKARQSSSRSASPRTAPDPTTEFKAKHKLGVTLAADVDRKVIEALRRVGREDDVRPEVRWG